MMINDYPIFKG
jgi:hypothetical protein